MKKWTCKSNKKQQKKIALMAVGAIFGVTRERIRQVESKALRKLKHPSRAKYLKDYIID